MSRHAFSQVTAVDVFFVACAIIGENFSPDLIKRSYRKQKRTTTARVEGGMSASQQESQVLVRSLVVSRKAINRGTASPYGCYEIKVQISSEKS